MARFRLASSACGVQWIGQILRNQVRRVFVYDVVHSKFKSNLFFVQDERTFAETSTFGIWNKIRHEFTVLASFICCHRVGRPTTVSHFLRWPSHRIVVHLVSSMSQTRVPIVFSSQHTENSPEINSFKKCERKVFVEFHQNYIEWVLGIFKNMFENHYYCFKFVTRLRNFKRPN